VPTMDFLLGEQLKSRWILVRLTYGARSACVFGVFFR
jgi:ABC-type microcin C transport system permease subunit YejE